ncbi:MAG: hypothetical protein QOE93_1062 [Actinomycetota bacterium]|jgi:hypothetical protein|nr:hypothetical protein [Actinomycetota bacterium]
MDGLSGAKEADELNPFRNSAEGPGVRAPGPSSRRWVVLAAGVAALALLVACDRSTVRPVAGPGVVDDASDLEVIARLWPERVTPSATWGASLSGTGPRVTLTTGGTIVGGLGHTTVSLGPPAEDRPTEGQALLLPGGGRWYPQRPFVVEAEGDVPFGTLRNGPDSDGVYPFAAAGADARVFVDLDGLIAAAGGALPVKGQFVRSDGAEVDRLVLPAGTTVAPACDDPAATTTSSPFPDASCADDRTGRLNDVTVEAPAGTIVRTSGDGEVAMAGRRGPIQAQALGHTWDGLVVAVEGAQVDAAATFDGRDWSVTATVGDARQVWVDVWPVVDTVLEARSFSTAPGFFDTTRLLRVEWVNVGWATAQILEAEGVGIGGPGIGFQLNKTLGHDAGLGVRWGDKVVNLGGGGDVDSNLPAGAETDRELSYRAGQPATLVLRGNFPEVPIELAVPGT